GALADGLGALGQGPAADLARRWQRLWQGGPRVPKGGKDPSPQGRIEHTCLAALEAIVDDDLEEAVGRGRRAVRMARTEGLVLYELLSSLVLARCRRLEGRPHLAMRILSSVAQVAPPPWRGWLRYEQWLSGEPSRPDPTAGSFPPYACLEGLLHAAAKGDRKSIQRATNKVPWWVRHELGVLAESLDPERSPHASPAGWLDGTKARCPKEIVGLCVPDIGPEGESSPVLLWVRPDRPARRLIALGAPLLNVAQPASFNLSQARTFTTIAHLAAEPGLSRGELFQRVYGFPYLPDRHGGTLRVLLHRVRKAMPEGLSLDEGDALHVGQDVLLPDPRIEFEQETLVLRHLARNAGRASAQEIAVALGVSARTVQNTLRTLLDDGICTSIREGRRIEYRLEDTTLSEPTISRLHPKGLTQF
ncbi:MAG: HTH domain-containing protein, partial [Myxococcota bacterium]